MNVVFVAHYFPPLNSTGSRRVLALAKYLDRLGHDVTVITTKKSTLDGPLSEEVPSFVRLIQVPESSETDLLPTPASKPGQVSRLASIVRLIRRLLVAATGQLIDPRLLFALRLTGSVPAVTDALTNADVLITSAPPWPVHLAGYRLAHKFKVPWIADYRDQFSGSPLMTGTAISRIIERAIDQHLCARADAVLTVSAPMHEYYQRWNTGTHILPNGFDAERLPAPSLLPSDQRSLRKTLRYIGRSSDGHPPTGLLQALETLPSTTLEKLSVEFIGENSESVRRAAQGYPRAATVIRCLPIVPYDEALRLMIDADALLVTQTWDGGASSSRGVVTTKLLEYMGAKRPIVGELDPDTSAAHILVRSGLAVTCSREPKVLAAGLEQVASGSVAGSPDSAYIATFSREGQARELVRIVASLIERR